MKKTIILLTVIFSLPFVAAAQQVNLDSLYTLWQDQTQTDSLRAAAYKDYIWNGFLFSNSDSAFVLAEELFAFGQKSKEPKTTALALHIQGSCFYVQANYPKALIYFKRSLKIREEIGDKKGISGSIGNIGLVYQSLNNYPKSLEYYERGLKMYEEIGDKKGIANALINIGNIYNIQGNNDKALDYYQRSLKMAEATGDKKNIALSIGNMAIIYKRKGNYPKALDYYERSLKILKEIGNQFGMTKLLNNMAIIYEGQGNYPKALEYYHRSLKIAEDLEDKNTMAAALNNIGLIYKEQGNFPQALDYFGRSLKIEKEIGRKKGVARAFQNIGIVCLEQDNYLKALDYFKRSLKIAEEIEDKIGMSNSFNHIGVIYKRQRDYSKALDYYDRSLKIREETEDKNGIAASLNNIGGIYSEQGKYPKALGYHERSLKIAEEIGHKEQFASALDNIGLIYMNQGNNVKALYYFDRSITIKEEIGDKMGMALPLTNIGSLYNKQGEHAKAIRSCKKSLALSQEVGAVKFQIDACECLFNAYKALGNSDEALVYMDLMRSAEDSIHAVETAKKLQQMEFDKQVLQDSIATAEKERLVQEAHQDEMRAEEQTRNIAFGGGFVLLIIAGGLFGRMRYIRKSKAVLQVEKDRSENLLLNILPADIAAELKEKGKADARDFDLVSILFTDFKGFTEQSAKLSAADLVNEINHCFEAFDGIMEKYGIEKIKTIGDAYMAAGGLPVPTNDSVKNTVLAALEMQAFITSRKAKMDAAGKPAFEMRVGIHTGPVVAGIVGVKKFQYDIWGDTVNTASRMESAGEVGKVNISQATYKLLQADQGFEFESRGKIEAKGKGEMEMYFVSKT